jgi:hypothetical protein
MEDDYGAIGDSVAGMWHGDIVSAHQRGQSTNSGGMDKGEFQSLSHLYETQVS